MSQIRAAAVAGSFYPSHAEELRDTVDAMLAEAASEEPCPKAVIAPHAGYIYSGPVAATLYARVRNGADKISRVVLLGPSHRVGFRGIAACSSELFQTPLGPIPIDRESVQRVVKLPAAGYLDQAHATEHSLEVHLPFLQRALGEFVLVPLVVGEADAADVARVLDALWGGEETLIVISSDLSHYQSYDEASHKDRETCARIEALSVDLKGDEACGCKPINGLLKLARQRGLSIRTVDYRNSGDTAGSRDSVVGYGAYALYEARQEEQQLPLALRQQLVQLARNAIFDRLQNGSGPRIRVDDFPEPLRRTLASFVTINLNGQLRGCIGSLKAHRPLVEDIAQNAQAAAFHDPRFKPLTLAEYLQIDLHISILSEPAPVAAGSLAELLQVLRPGRDGLIIEENGRRATYLPSVWEQLPDAETFVKQLRIKAGLDPNGWTRATRVYRYTTEEFT